MPVNAVIGGQWGDEGKGKIIDILSHDADIVARFQGGANAGHTICINDEETVLHQLPSGILREGKQCILGNGMVIDPITLLEEMQKLRSQGIDIGERLHISLQAHIVTPVHKLMDAVLERQRGKDAIGTTKRGIGPCYSDKIARSGLRVRGLVNMDNAHKKIDAQIKQYAEQGLFTEQDVAELNKQMEDFIDAASQIIDYRSDTVNYLHEALENNKSVLVEGAQGTMLDIDFGSYPFVTSSNTTAGNIMSGLGLNPFQLDTNYGIVKAYLTRVGQGPFPTEQENEIGEYLQEAGSEFGATTGRPRRCGWLDLVLAKYAIRVNGFSSLVITKLDVLDALDEIKVCTAYDEGIFPATPLNQATPQYKTLPGWNTSISHIRKFKNLPQEAKNYLEFIENNLETRISSVSVGKSRDQIIRLD
ncbi:MAG TPA: adenylosuccinate synthase [bacterium]|nr:adenylosuccinate synthase [bacterium]